MGEELGNFLEDVDMGKGNERERVVFGEVLE